jgi:hypothetical protein
MMITDGQLLYESWVYGGTGNGYKGLAVILGSGAVPDGTALMTACKYTATGYRMVSVSALNTYIRTTLGRTVYVDASFANVSDIMLKGGYIFAAFSKATATPTILVSGSPTWGIIISEHGATPVDGTQCLTGTNVWSYARRLYLFSVGASGSGADLILPGDGSLIAGQVFRLSDIKIPIGNVVC